MKVTVGQEVVMIRSGNYGYQYTFDMFVTKVTPTGRFTIRRKGSDFDYKFDAAGDQMGERFSRQWVQTDVEACRANADEKIRRQIAAAAIQDVQPTQRVNNQWDKESLQKVINELKAKLAVAEELVKQI